MDRFSAMTERTEKKTVIVRIEGGVVQNVDCPSDIQVVIQDFDVEGLDQADLAEDDKGGRYLKMTWGHRH